MKEGKNYAVYIATNYPRKTVLYTGVTNNVFERGDQHESKTDKKSFTAKYNVNRIVYYETYNDITAAIEREKEIKGWIRVKKERLVNSINPEWKDIINESLK